MKIRVSLVRFRLWAPLKSLKIKEKNILLRLIASVLLFWATYGLQKYCGPSLLELQTLWPQQWKIALFSTQHENYFCRRTVVGIFLIVCGKPWTHRQHEKPCDFTPAPKPFDCSKKYGSVSSGIASTREEERSCECATYSDIRRLPACASLSHCRTCCRSGCRIFSSACCV